MPFWDNPAYAAAWQELASGELATWLQLTPYAYAALEGVHLIGVAVFFGAVFLLDLRLLGLTPALHAQTTGRFLLRIAAPAFALLAVSGALLFVPSADRYASSPVFFVKLAAMAAGGLNALAFHVTAWRRIDAWGAGARSPWMARAAAVVSVLVWVTVIALGRWMGYERRAPPPADFDDLPFARAVELEPDRTGKT